MPNAISGLDHVVVACPDLEKAAADFARLGFALTPPGQHPEWGTRNRCLMFPDSYVQLLAPDGDGPEALAVRDFLSAERQGGHSVAFGCADVDHTLTLLAQRGIDCPPARPLSRRMQDADGSTLQFREALLPVEATPGLRCRLIQHLSQERLRHPDWLNHPNGATGLLSVTAIVADPVALTADWDRLFGPHQSVITDDTVTVHCKRGLIYLSKPDDIAQLHPNVDEDDLPPPPALLVLTLSIADSLRARAILKANKVEYSIGTDGAIRIPPWEAGGVYLELYQG